MSPAALVFQSSAFRWAGLDVFTSRCCTSLQLSRKLQEAEKQLVPDAPDRFPVPNLAATDRRFKSDAQRVDL